MAADLEAAVQSLSKTASELARRWATQRLSAVQSYGRILADYGGGRASGKDAAQAYAKLAMEEAARYPSEAFQIATDYANAVARAAGLSLATGQTPMARSPVVDIELAGMIGKVVERTFVLENPHDVPADIRFTATNFLDGDQEVNAKPTFAPASVSIPKGGEVEVTISAKADRKQFQAGRTYRSSVAVEGIDDMVIRVLFSVTGAP